MRSGWGLGQGLRGGSGGGVCVSIRENQCIMSFIKLIFFILTINKKVIFLIKKNTMYFIFLRV